MTREYRFKRKTKETDISGSLKLDGTGKNNISTGIGFLDHMLQLFSFHSQIDLELTCKGDLEVCPHHTIEDIALSLGNALNQALGDRIGIKRYSTFYLPMDETLTRTSLDISGRAYHVFKGDFFSDRIGAMPTEMVQHFFYSLASTAKLTLHQEILYGENDHHKAESLFKGLAKCISEATAIDSEQIPSSKGVL